MKHAREGSGGPLMHRSEAVFGERNRPGDTSVLPIRPPLPFLLARKLGIRQGSPRLLDTPLVCLSTRSRWGIALLLRRQLEGLRALVSLNQALSQALFVV